MAYKARFHGSHIGCHPQNRDGFGRSSSDVHELLDAILVIGWDDPWPTLVSKNKSCPHSPVPMLCHGGAQQCFRVWKPLCCLSLELVAAFVAFVGAKGSDSQGETLGVSHPCLKPRNKQPKRINWGVSQLRPLVIFSRENTPSLGSIACFA